MLKSIHELSDIELLSITTKINTGIEFEIAIYYQLNSSKDREIITDKIINNHPFKNKIIEIISNFDSYTFRKELNLVQEPEITYLTTQDDTVGPSDVVMKINEDLLGLSIKYSNNCNLNVSGSYFLSAESIRTIKQSYFEYGNKYIAEMNRKYGDVSNWFRQRKTSTIVDEFIDTIRDKVIFDWENHLTINQRIEIIKLGFHFESPIKFYIARVDKKLGKYRCEINKNPIREMNIENVVLRKHQSSFVSFEYENQVFALMQVKFNNGILENPKGNTFDFIENGVKMKFGSPLSSWNFNLK